MQRNKVLTPIRGLFYTCALLLAISPYAMAEGKSPPSRHFYVSQTTPAGTTPHFPGFDQVSGHVLVSNVSAGTVSEIKLGVGVVRTFKAQAQPHTVKVNALARRAYVTNKGSSTVSVLDLRTGATLVNFAVGANPHGLAFDRKRNRLYVTSIDLNRLEVYDLTTFQQLAIIPVGLGPWGVDAKGDRVVTTDTGGNTIHVLDADTLQVTDVVEVGNSPWNPSIGESGTVYVTVQSTGEVVAVDGDEVVWRTLVGTKPLGIVADESRDVVLAQVSGSSQVAAIAARTGRLLQLVDVAAQPAGIDYDFMSGNAYSADQGGGVVSTLTPMRARRR